MNGHPAVEHDWVRDAVGDLALVDAVGWDGPHRVIYCRGCAAGVCVDCQQGALAGECPRPAPPPPGSVFEFLRARAAEARALCDAMAAHLALTGHHGVDLEDAPAVSRRFFYTFALPVREYAVLDSTAALVDLAAELTASEIPAEQATARRILKALTAHHEDHEDWNPAWLA